MVVLAPTIFTSLTRFSCKFQHKFKIKKVSWFTLLEGFYKKHRDFNNTLCFVDIVIRNEKNEKIYTV